MADSIIRVSRPVKKRLDEMQLAMQVALNRQVTMSEILEGLLKAADADKSDEVRMIRKGGME